MIWAPCGSGEVADGLGAIWGAWVGGGNPHTHAHACACMHMCAHAHVCEDRHDNFIANGCSPLEISHCLSCLTCMHVCAHVRARACVHVHVRMCMGVPPPNSTAHPPTPLGGTTSQISKNSIRIERIKIIRFCLKI